jgi:hypothetical protein
MNDWDVRLWRACSKAYEAVIARFDAIATVVFASSQDGTAGAAGSRAQTAASLIFFASFVLLLCGVWQPFVFSIGLMLFALVFATILVLAPVALTALPVVGIAMLFAARTLPEVIRGDLVLIGGLIWLRVLLAGTGRPRLAAMATTFVPTLAIIAVTYAGLLFAYERVPESELVTAVRYARHFDESYERWRPYLDATAVLFLTALVIASAVTRVQGLDTWWTRASRVQSMIGRVATCAFALSFVAIEAPRQYAETGQIALDAKREADDQRRQAQKDERLAREHERAAQRDLDATKQARRILQRRLAEFQAPQVVIARARAQAIVNELHEDIAEELARRSSRHSGPAPETSAKIAEPSALAAASRLRPDVARAVAAPARKARRGGTTLLMALYARVIPFATPSFDLGSGFGSRLAGEAVSDIESETEEQAIEAWYEGALLDRALAWSRHAANSHAFLRAALRSPGGKRVAAWLTARVDRIDDRDARRIIEADDQYARPLLDVLSRGSYSDRVDPGGRLVPPPLVEHPVFER